MDKTLPIILPKRTELQNAVACELIAVSGLNVMLTGETGTGKTYVAKYLHDLAAKRHGVWKNTEPVNFAAVPETVAESLLFGQLKGAYTGAEAMPGMLADAKASGCIILDEIGHAPRAVQAKLLTVIEERRFRMLGQTKDADYQDFDARIIATASNPRAILPELWFRLAQIRVHVPPLREQAERIESLAKALYADALRTHHKTLNGHSIRMSDGVLKRLAKRRWDGNVRELKNMMLVCAVFADDSGDLTEEWLECAEQLTAAPPGARDSHEGCNEHGMRQYFMSAPLEELRYPTIMSIYAECMRLRLDGRLHLAKELIDVSDDTLRTHLRRLTNPRNVGDSCEQGS